MNLQAFLVVSVAILIVYAWVMGYVVGFRRGLAHAANEFEKVMAEEDRRAGL